MTPMTAPTSASPSFAMDVFLAGAGLGQRIAGASAGDQARACR